MDFFGFYWTHTQSRLCSNCFFLFLLARFLVKTFWTINWKKCFHFWAQKLTHNVSFWAQKWYWLMGNISGPRNRDYGSVSGPRNRDYGSTKFLGPETDIMGQFLGPETGIMGERYFMEDNRHPSLFGKWETKVYVTHKVSFWAQKLCWPIIMISGPKNWHNLWVSR